MLSRSLTAAAASSSESTTNPVSPSTMISGRAPWRVAISGVPQAWASAATRPNGSHQLIGKRTAAAFW